MNFLVLQNKRQGFRSLMPKRLTLFSPQAYFYEFLPSPVITKVTSDFFFVICLWIYHLNDKKRHIKHMLFKAALVNMFSEMTLRQKSTLKNWNESWEPEGFPIPLVNTARSF